MFQLAKEASDSGQALSVISGSFEQKLSSPHHIQPQTKAFTVVIQYLYLPGFHESLIAWEPHEAASPECSQNLNL